MMGVNFYLVICAMLIGNIVFGVRASYSKTNTVKLQQTLENGKERFPDSIELNFVHEGENVRLSLIRDDVTTEYLSETLFETARNLPSNVYTDENSEHFSAYSSPEADLVIQRESNTEPFKVYGGFSKYGEKYVIASIDGDHEHHRVLKQSQAANSENALDISMDREGNIRYRRDIEDIPLPNTHIVELFVWADYSIYEHFNENVLTNYTAGQLKLYIRDYMRSITKDLDTLFRYMETYGLVNFRIYFTQYQVATKTLHTPWIKNNLLGLTLSTASAMADFLSYYKNMTLKFAFPSPDHIMVLTRYDLDNSAEYYLENTVCGPNTTYSASFVRTYYIPKVMAQVLAKAIGGDNITFDDANECEDEDYNIMSAYYNATPDANRGNYWKFSLCNVDEFADLLENYNLTCLKEQDECYDLANTINFYDWPAYGSNYTADQQCQNQFGRNSSFCNLLDGAGVDCFSGRDGCLDGSVCVEYRVGDETPCAGGTMCKYGFCLNSDTTTLPANETTKNGITTNATRMYSSSPLFPNTTEAMSTNFTFPSSSIDPPSTSPIDPFNSTIFNTTTADLVTITSPINCYVKTGVVEFDLPGCECCGDCGCDDECTECSDGLGRPKANGSQCKPKRKCVPSKVRVTTYTFPEDCPLAFTSDNNIIVINKLGLDETDYDIKAKAYNYISGEWQVDLEVMNPDDNIDGGI